MVSSRGSCSVSSARARQASPVKLYPELHALDARALDVLVLPFERVEVGDHVVDEIVDVIVERGQRQLVVLA